MFFLQQPDLPLDALGRITLGPLECVETSKYLNCSINMVECNLNINLKIRNVSL